MIRTAKLHLSLGLIWLAAMVALCRSVAVPQTQFEEDTWTTMDDTAATRRSTLKATPDGTTLLQWRPCSSSPYTVPAIVTNSWFDPLSVKKAYILIHGMGRNPDFAITMLKQLADPNEHVIIAPGFYLPSDEGGDNFYDSNINLAWNSFEDWVGGSDAISPSAETCSTYNVVDSMYRHYISGTRFPNLESVTFIGHSGGAAFVSHYGLFEPSPKRNDIKLRWVYANAPVFPYVNSARSDSYSDCQSTYNNWMYGIADNLPRYVANRLGDPTSTFRRYIAEEVYQMIGEEDTYAKYHFGTQTCETQAQGGVNRRDRNIAWWNFLNLMARTGDHTLRGTYGYAKLASTLSSGDYVGVKPASTKFRNKSCLIPGVGHVDLDMYSSACGRDFIFNN